jgi:hypothetical protein
MPGPIRTRCLSRCAAIRCSGWRKAKAPRAVAQGLGISRRTQADSRCTAQAGAGHDVKITITMRVRTVERSPTRPSTPAQGPISARIGWKSGAIFSATSSHPGSESTRTHSPSSASWSHLNSSYRPRATGEVRLARGAGRSAVLAFPSC